MNAAEKTLLKIQERRAKHHRDSFLFKVYKTEISRRVQTRLATQKLGVSATRRLRSATPVGARFATRCVRCGGVRAVTRRRRGATRVVARTRWKTARCILKDENGLGRGSVETEKTLTFETASRRRSGARRATRATRRRSGRWLPPRRARCVSALLRSMRARWRARNDADAEQTRRRLGKVWSDAVARTTAVAFGFPGIFGSESREPSSSERSSERLPGKRFRENPLFAMTGLKNKRRNGPPHRRRRGGHPRGGSARPRRGRRRRGARAGRRRRRDPFFFATGKPSRELGVIADDAPGVRFFSPDPSPSRASDGFRSARSSMPSSRTPRARPRRRRRRRRRRQRGGAATDATGRGRAVPRGRPPRRRRSAFCASASPPGSRRAPKRRRRCRGRPRRRGGQTSAADADGAVSPDRRRNSSAMLEMRARFDTK